MFILGPLMQSAESIKETSKSYSDATATQENIDFSILGLQQLIGAAVVTRGLADLLKVNAARLLDEDTIIKSGKRWVQADPWTIEHGTNAVEEKLGSGQALRLRRASNRLIHFGFETWCAQKSPHRVAIWGQLPGAKYELVCFEVPEFANALAKFHEKVEVELRGLDGPTRENFRLLGIQ